MGEHDLDSGLTPNAPVSETTAESWPPRIGNAPTALDPPAKKRLPPIQAFFSFLGMFLAGIVASPGLWFSCGLILYWSTEIWPSTYKIFQMPLFYVNPSQNPSTGFMALDLVFLIINVAVLALTVRLTVLRKAISRVWGFSLGFVLSSIIIECFEFLF